MDKPLPNPVPTWTITPHTLGGTQHLDHGNEISIRNESGEPITVRVADYTDAITVQAGELAEVRRQRDDARRKLRCAEIVFRSIVSRFEYLQGLWGKEAITDETLRMARECVELIESQEPTL